MPADEGEVEDDEGRGQRRDCGDGGGDENFFSFLSSARRERGGEETRGEERRGAVERGDVREMGFVTGNILISGGGDGDGGGGGDVGFGARRRRRRRP